MCLIVFHPACDFDFKTISQIRVWNGDGVGYMYAEDGRIKSDKGLWSNVETENKLNAIKGKPVTVHFRSQTKGSVSVENCQPFRILSKDEGDLIDLYMVHNGTLTSIKLDEYQKSDTYYYANKFMTPILKLNPILIYQEEFQKMLGASLGNNKLVFMDGDGNVVIINESLGKKLDNGSWISNQYSLKPKKVPYSYNSSSGSGKWNTDKQTWEYPKYGHCDI